MAVQRLFRFLERQGVILQDPTLNLVLPSWKKLTRAVLNQAHARRLVASPDPTTPRGRRDRALLELLYGTAYDPKIGRFISEDPIGFGGGVNFYQPHER